MRSEKSIDGADAYAVYRSAVGRTFGPIDPPPLRTRPGCA